MLIIKGLLEYANCCGGFQVKIEREGDESSLEIPGSFAGEQCSCLPQVSDFLNWCWMLETH
jgi:hypothetical protein